MRKFAAILILLAIAAIMFAQLPVGNRAENQTVKTSNLWNKFVMLQKKLNSRLSETMLALEQHLSAKTLLLLFGIAFVYGVLHAAGPGHGKMLVGSYFLGSSGSWKTAIKVGSTVAMTHNGAAILLGLIFGLMLRAAGMEDRTGLQRDIQIASGVMIILVGLVYFVVGFPAVRRKMRRFAETRHDILIGVLSGIVPCPVALTVILFATYLGKTWLGILAVVALSFGMAMTVSLIGIVAVRFRGSLAKLSQRGFDGDRIASVFSFVGSFGITLAGVLLILAVV